MQLNANIENLSHEETFLFSYAENTKVQLRTNAYHSIYR